MNRLNYPKSKEQERIEKIIILIEVFISLLIMLAIGIIGALKDARTTEETVAEENRQKGVLEWRVG